MDILINLLKEIAIFLVIGYFFSKTPVFKLLLTKEFSLIDRWTLYIFFTTMAIIGTYLGIPVKGAIANNRVIGAAVAGLIGGPTLGFSVRLTAGIHRYFLGGFTAVSCSISISDITKEAIKKNKIVLLMALMIAIIAPFLKIVNFPPYWLSQ